MSRRSRLRAAAVVQNADGDFGFAQQTFHSLRGRGRPAAFIRRNASIEIGGERKCLDEQQPRLRGVFRARVFERKSRGECFAVIRQCDGKRIGQWPGCVETVQAIVRPVEKCANKRRKICDGEECVVVAGRDLLRERKETLLRGERVPVEHDLRIHKRRRRNDKAVLLDVAQPGLVVAKSCVVDGHGQSYVPRMARLASASSSSRRW